MWRALFLAIGGTLLVIGIESMIFDHAVLATDTSFAKAAMVTQTQPAYDEWGFELEKKVVVPVAKKISPPEWAPWSMLSSGAVILFYGLASKVRGE